MSIFYNFSFNVNADFDEKKESDSIKIAKALWETVPDSDREWLTAQLIEYWELRAGPSWIAMTNKSYGKPVSIARALIDYCYFSHFRSGYLQTDNGARVWFSFSDFPQMSFSKIQIPNTGEKLEPAHSIILPTKRVQTPQD